MFQKLFQLKKTQKVLDALKQELMKTAACKGASSQTSTRSCVVNTLSYWKDEVL